MRKLAIFALTLIILAGCNDTTHFQDGSLYIKGDDGGIKLYVIEFQDCEYITGSAGHGKIFTHKGNCKQCLAREEKRSR